MPEEANKDFSKLREIAGTEQAAPTPKTTDEDILGKGLESRPKNVIVIVILATVFIIILGLVGLFALGIWGTSEDDSGENVIIPPGSNSNTAMSNTNGNDNTNAPLVISGNQELTFEGRVYRMGIDTPSESYGIYSTDGNSIGLGKYDSMKERFRIYDGERISVTFESICRTSDEDCCKTLFPYCGTVKEWEPLEGD